MQYQKAVADLCPEPPLPQQHTALLSSLKLGPLHEIEGYFRATVRHLQPSEHREGFVPPMEGCDITLWSGVTWICEVPPVPPCVLVHCMHHHPAVCCSHSATACIRLPGTRLSGIRLPGITLWLQTVGRLTCMVAQLVHRHPE